jgi:hypothetical protein
MIHLMVRPVGYSSRGQLFEGIAVLAGANRLVVARSIQPLLDAARVLFSDGIDPAVELIMRHAGTTHDALRSTVGLAAQLTVWNTDNGSPAFKAHRPWNGLQVGPGEPLMREIQPIRRHRPQTHLRAGGAVVRDRNSKPRHEAT